MSTYRKSSDKGPTDIHVDFGVTHAQWESTSSDALLRAGAVREEGERSKRSKGEPSNAVLSRTAAWAAGLPPEIQPHELLRLFARVANQLAADWTEPDATRAYFRELLTSRRATRAGFPEQVESELLALSRYYSTLHPESPERARAWQDVRKR